MPSPPDNASSSGQAIDAGPEDSEPTAVAQDVVVVQGATEHGALVVRLKSEGQSQPTVEIGELRPLREGQPIVGEVLKLTQRAEDERVFDAEVLARPSLGAGSIGGSKHEGSQDNALVSRSVPDNGLPHKGPPRVTTDAFRENWDGIFGSTPPRGAPN